MMTKSFLVPFLLMCSIAGAASADSKMKTRNNKPAAKLGTSFRFDGTSLNGKYQKSPSTTAIVEDDKFIEDLLGARKHFRDRIQNEQNRL